jgi:GTP1/Obg family GTP-binding protein
MATKKTKTTRKTAPRKRAAASKKKQPKLEELSQTTGKDFDTQVARAKELEEIMGFHKSSPFRTTDPKVFEKNLEDINLTDLQAMAVRVGVFPSGNKTVLKNKVKRAFNTSLHGQGSVTLVGKPVVELDPNNPLHKKVLDYLKD